MKRFLLASEVPALDESGFPGFNVTACGSLVAPASTSPAIVAQRNDKTNKVLRMPEMRTPFNNGGYEPTRTTGDADSHGFADVGKSHQGSQYPAEAGACESRGIFVATTAAIPLTANSLSPILDLYRIGIPVLLYTRRGASKAGVAILLFFANQSLGMK